MSFALKKPGRSALACAVRRDGLRRRGGDCSQGGGTKEITFRQHLNIPSSLRLVLRRLCLIPGLRAARAMSSQGS
jgi:hypothetical protein